MIIEVDDFNLRDTVTCGQIFRYEELNDGSFIIVLKDRIIKIKQEKNKLIVKSSNNDNLENVIRDYFDLNNYYKKINDYIIERDINNKLIIDSSVGLKIINEPKFEVIISYILSSNNRVSQIKKALDNISKRYGRQITFEDNNYYLFPSLEEISDCKIEELRELKTGFRDKYIYEFINKVKNNEFDIDKINNMDSETAINYLKTLNGVGEKVASCILLFGFHRFDVFPIDTWVKKYMKEKYGVDDVKIIKKIMKEKYNEYSGIAIQYAFNYKRNKS